MKNIIKGIHHLSLKCQNDAEFEKTVYFYTEVLGLKIVRNWNKNGSPACMIDLGNGGLEIFSDAEQKLGQGAIRHFALLVDSVDEVLAKVENAGYHITRSPSDNIIPSNPSYAIRTAFFKGPVGEEIELFQER